MTQLNLTIGLGIMILCIEVIDEADQDGKDFIDYLGFNVIIFLQRELIILKTKRNTRVVYSWEILQYLRMYKNDLSYITAIENEFHIDLSAIINDI
jgi:hypothetical protein